MCKGIQEYNTFIRYLMSIVISGHFQQTSVCLSVAANKVGIRRQCLHTGIRTQDRSSTANSTCTRTSSQAHKC